MKNFLRTIHNKRIYHLCLVLFVFGLSACSGGSSSSSSDNGTDTAVLSHEIDNDTSTISTPDTTPPESTLKSPLFSRTTTNTSIHITGSSSDDKSTIASVTVNGFETESEDGYENWSINLPLHSKISNLKVETEDQSGNKSSKVHDLTFTRLNTIFSAPSTIVIDENSNNLLINDALQQTSYSSNLASPSLYQITANSDESGLLSPHRSVFDTIGNNEIILDLRETQPVTQGILSRDITNNITVLEAGLNNVIDISLDQTKRILYVLFAPENSETGGIIKVYDLKSGLAHDEWPILSDNSKNGPEFINPSAIIFHNNRLYCADGTANRILSIDLATGDKTNLIDQEQASEVIFSYIKDIVAYSDKLWLLDEDTKRIIEIDSNSGSRSILSGANDSNGTPFKYFNQIVIDTLNERLLVSDTELNVIFSVDIDTGKRELFISNRHGNGPSMPKPKSLKHAGSETVLIIDSTLEALVSINLATGNRHILSTAGSEKIKEVGVGPRIKDPIGIELNTDFNKAWISMREQASLLEVDLITGDRSLIRPNPAEGATAFKLPNGISYDADNNRILVSDIYLDRVQAIELDSNNTTIAAKKYLTSDRSIKLSKPLDTVFDNVNKRIYTLDSALKAILVWDITSKTSTVLTSLTIGSGVSLVKPVAIDLNITQNKAYVADEKLNSIVTIDLSNGNRTVLSNRAVGTGPTFKKLSGISFNKTTASLLATDIEEQGVFSINIENGNRELISK